MESCTPSTCLYLLVYHNLPYIIGGGYKRHPSGRRDGAGLAPPYRVPVQMQNCTCSSHADNFSGPGWGVSRYRRTAGVENSLDKDRQGTVYTPLASIHSSIHPSTIRAGGPGSPRCDTPTSTLGCLASVASFSALSLCLQLVFPKLHSAPQRPVRPGHEAALHLR